MQTLKDNLKNYSGKSDSTVNPEIDREDLNWRVLDVTKEGNVRLISATPTTKKIELYGYNGYNNAVKLLDDACSTLYTNKKLSSKVQNIKIEDITKYMKTNPTDDTTVYNPTNINYPKILEQEENQIVDKTTSNSTKFDVNSQQGWVIGKDISAASSLKKTYWVQRENNADVFKNGKYFELYIKRK